MKPKTLDEINKRIKKGDAVVLTADEIIDFVDEIGVEKAVKEVDVVTTGTFGAMCSSGVFLNFGHSDPPIKMSRVWLNNVEAYTGLAAVDAYLGVTQLSEDKGFDYGGGHVIEDLVSGKEVILRAEAYGTDCYPRKKIETPISLQDINQAIMFNPRNAYQNYNAATNSTDKTIYTYMGVLLPNYGNVTYATTGQLSPLLNDPEFLTIGVGTKILLCGAEGYVINEGTQHNTKVKRKGKIPIGPAGTLMVAGDLKEMDPKYLRGATFYRYGTTLYVGIGVPIPILNEESLRNTLITNKDIATNIVDYSIPSRSRPSIREVTYAELRSGKVEIDGRAAPTSPLSSLYMAREIAEDLKNMIEKGDFLLQGPIKGLKDSEFKPLQIKKKETRVGDLMKQVAKVDIGAELNDVVKLLVKERVDHVVIVDKDGLRGIVTTWDITKAFFEGLRRLEEVMTKEVIVTSPEESVDVAARKMEKYNISGLPVIKEEKVVGIITSSVIAEVRK